MSTIANLFTEKVSVLNVGLTTFADDLASQHIPVVQLEWTMPDEETLRGQELAARLIAAYDSERA